MTKGKRNLLILLVLLATNLMVWTTLFLEEKSDGETTQQSLGFTPEDFALSLREAEAPPKSAGRDPFRPPKERAKPKPIRALKEYIVFNGSLELGGELTAGLKIEGKSYQAKEGSLIEGRYQVLKIEMNRILIRDLTTKREETIFQ